MSDLDLNTHSGAVFSDDKYFRYALWRKWNLREPKKFITFIGLNPSRANESFNDPTITRLIDFAKRWGYDGMYMANLFGWRSPVPDFLKSVGLDPFVGGDTDWWVKKMCFDSETIVVCWGNFKVACRDEYVLDYLTNPLCFGKNANGSPKHPLYLKRSTTLEPFKKQPAEVPVTKDET